MTVLKKPERMRIKEAKEKFYPNSFLMINCENMWDDYNFFGDIIAYAPLETQGYLIDWMDKMIDEGYDGDCTVEMTKDILDGGPLLGEIYIAN